MTRRLQNENEVGEAGALGLAEGLKSNSCLQAMGLVRVVVAQIFHMVALRF